MLSNNYSLPWLAPLTFHRIAIAFGQRPNSCACTLKTISSRPPSCVHHGVIRRWDSKLPRGVPGESPAVAAESPPSLRHRLSIGKQRRRCVFQRVLTNWCKVVFGFDDSRLVGGRGVKLWEFWAMHVDVRTCSWRNRSSNSTGGNARTTSMYFTTLFYVYTRL